MEMWDLLERSLQALEQALSAQGHNVGLNLGGAAGAGIADHLHLHVVPRWRGDVNFMPVLGNVRVMPQLLLETRAALVDAWPR
jgi:ATP adenylyltransferase